jgi:hypothetical protein
VREPPRTTGRSAPSSHTTPRRAAALRQEQRRGENGRRSRVGRVRPAAWASWEKGIRHDVTMRQAQGGPPVKVRSGEMPGSLVAKPPRVAERPGAKRGGCDRAVCNVSEARASVVMRPAPRAGGRGCRAGSSTAKAREGVPEPGAGAEEPSGVLGVERADGRPGNWGEPPRPRRLRGGGKRCPPITGEPGKWRSGRAAVGAGRSSGDRRAAKRARSEGPALHRRT